MLDENTKIAATDAYNRGALEECGSYLGLEPVAIKYGHSFDETPESYSKRLRAALDIPDPAPPGEPEQVAKDAPRGRAPHPVPESEQEDAPEPEDTEPPHHRRTRR